MKAILVMLETLTDVGDTNDRLHLEDFLEQSGNIGHFFDWKKCSRIIRLNLLAYKLRYLL